MAGTIMTNYCFYFFFLIISGKIFSPTENGYFYGIVYDVMLNLSQEKLTLLISTDTRLQRRDFVYYIKLVIVISNHCFTLLS